MTNAERKDRTVSGTTTPTDPLPPPGAGPTTPAVPSAGPNLRPHVARHAADQPVATTPAPRRRVRSRTRIYGVGAACFIVLSLVGYFGFRQYIYGDDAPPIPVLDE